MSQVSGLTIYPIKGCKGITLEKARICSTGFNYDRRWVIIKDRNSQFESQRKDPKMALIETAISAEDIISELPSPDADLIIRVPGQEDLKIPLREDPTKLKREASVWNWTGEAIDEGDFASEYISDYMGHKVRLMRYAGNPDQGQPEDHMARRALDPKFAPKHTETAFSDAMPFLVTNEASLKDLNSRCPEFIPMNRFRPNIVVSGSNAWDEDTWQQMKLGDITFTATMPTGRCTVTTVNQTTATPSQIMEPLKTLGTYRKGSQLGWDADRSWKALVFFGWYFLSEQQGIVSVGDKMEILQQRDGAPQEWKT